ncbi:hypothetical protein ISS37_03740 [candidate division KSB1 bacterium]|nr:hypothetical protein [candidate division KSB1 bacterium]
MEKEQKLQMINEIKRIERELYLKKSRLTSAEAMEYGSTLPSLLAKGLDANNWRKVFSELIEKIGLSSTGGHSVEDIKRERQR